MKYLVLLIFDSAVDGYLSGYTVADTCNQRIIFFRYRHNEILTPGGNGGRRQLAQGVLAVPYLVAIATY